MLSRLPESAQAVLARATLRLPRPVLSAVLRGRRSRYDGAFLDERAELMCRLADLAGRPPIHTLAPSAARAEAKTQMLALAPPRARLHSVIERTVPGPHHTIPVRVYRPRAGRLALCAYFHGGGFVIGDLDTHDSICRLLALSSDAIVVAVDYRLAPEHKHPAAVEDAWAAFRWLCEHGDQLGGDALRVAVAGDSAGGNLSAVVSHRAQDAGVRPPAMQALLYPGLDLRCVTRSHRELGEGFLLTSAMIEWFIESYLRSRAQANDVEVSPGLRRDLRALPPTFMLIAGFDPLRDECEAHAVRLSEAGVAVQVHRFPDMVHGFLNTAGALPQGLAAIRACGAALREALAPRGVLA